MGDTKMSIRPIFSSSKELKPSQGFDRNNPAYQDIVLARKLLGPEFQEIGFKAYNSTDLQHALAEAILKINNDGGKLLHLPALVEFRFTNKDFNDALGNDSFTVFSADVYQVIGVNAGNKVFRYQAQHGCGTLSTLSGLTTALEDLGDYGLMPVRLIEKDEGIPIYTLEQARNNEIKDISKPFVVEFEGTIQIVSRNDNMDTMTQYRKDGHILVPVSSSHPLSFRLLSEFDDLSLARYGTQQNLDNAISLMSKTDYPNDKTSMTYSSAKPGHLLGTEKVDYNDSPMGCYLFHAFDTPGIQCNEHPISYTTFIGKAQDFQK